jgi:hypothetical protein
MANSKVSFSPKDFQLAIAPETTVGTPIEAAGQATYKYINIDSIEFPALNPQQVLDVRHGAGRTLKKVDMFLSNKLTVKEISFSGIADSTILPMLLSNITQETASTYDFEIAYDPDEIKVGEAATDNTKTFTVLLDSPQSGSQMQFPGCVLTSLTLNADIGEESGRVKFSGTFKTGVKPVLTGVSAITVTTATYFNSNYFMTDYGDAGDAGAATTIADIDDPVVKSFSLTMENDAQFMGFDADGNYQIIARALPEVSVTFDSTIKYDDETEGLINTFETQSTGTVANTLTALTSSTRNFGISIPAAVITDVSFSEEEAMFMSVSTKAVADAGETNLLSISVENS